MRITKAAAGKKKLYANSYNIKEVSYHHLDVWQTRYMQKPKGSHCALHVACSSFLFPNCYVLNKKSSQISLSIRGSQTSK